MAVILFQFEIMAATARTIKTIIRTAISMSVIQSTPSAIERATAQHKWLFAGYILLLLFTAVMTWLVWRSGNKLQDAVRDDANARIAEASDRASQADARAAEANREAAKANESRREG